MEDQSVNTFNVLSLFQFIEHFSIEPRSFFGCQWISSIQHRPTQWFWIKSQHQVKRGQKRLCPANEEDRTSETFLVPSCNQKSPTHNVRLRDYLGVSKREDNFVVAPDALNPEEMYMVKLRNSFPSTTRHIMAICALICLPTCSKWQSGNFIMEEATAWSRLHYHSRDLLARAGPV